MKKNKGMTQTKKYIILTVIVILCIASRGVLIIPAILGLVYYNSRKRAKRVPPVLPTAQKPRNSFQVGEPGRGFTASVAESNIRVTAAQRDACVEQLSRQFGAGTLDQAEFGGRMESAMTAKRRFELDTLLLDLPVLSLPLAIALCAPRLIQGTSSHLTQGCDGAFAVTQKPPRYYSKSGTEGMAIR